MFLMLFDNTFTVGRNAREAFLVEVAGQTLGEWWEKVVAAARRGFIAARA